MFAKPGPWAAEQVTERFDPLASLQHVISPSHPEAETQICHSSRYVYQPVVISSAVANILGDSANNTDDHARSRRSHKAYAKAQDLQSASPVFPGEGKSCLNAVNGSA